MNWKAQLISTGVTLAVIALIYNVGALRGVSDIIGLNNKLDA